MSASIHWNPSPFARSTLNNVLTETTRGTGEPPDFILLRLPESWCSFKRHRASIRGDTGDTFIRWSLLIAVSPPRSPLAVRSVWRPRSRRAHRGATPPSFIEKQPRNRSNQQLILSGLIDVSHLICNIALRNPWHSVLFLCHTMARFLHFSGQNYFIFPLK